MATLLDALSQENLDNQREVVKNEKRWSYDNRPYGSFQEKLQAHLFPPEHPYHHTTIGSMDDLNAASVEDVSAFFRTYYAPNNAVLSVVGDVDTARRSPSPRRFFGAIPPNPDIPPLGDLSLPPTARWRASRGRPRQGAAAARPRRVPGAGLRRHAARRARSGRPDPVGRQGQPAQPPPRPRRADRPGRRDLHARRSPAARRSRPAGRRSGRASRSTASRRPSTRSSSG